MIAKQDVLDRARELRPNVSRVSPRRWFPPHRGRDPAVSHQRPARTRAAIYHGDLHQVGRAREAGRPGACRAKLGVVRNVGGGSPKCAQRLAPVRSYSARYQTFQPHVILALHGRGRSSSSRAVPNNRIPINMFEKAFKYIDDVLSREAGCATELDYIAELFKTRLRQPSTSVPSALFPIAPPIANRINTLLQLEKRDLPAPTFSTQVASRARPMFGPEEAVTLMPHDSL
jgi:hypothetical protein